MRDVSDAMECGQGERGLSSRDTKEVRGELCASLSLLLSRTQGYCYHLSKFHCNLASDLNISIFKSLARLQFK